MIYGDIYLDDNCFGLIRPSSGRIQNLKAISIRSHNKTHHTGSRDGVMIDKLPGWEEDKIEIKFERWANDTAAMSKPANSCD
jgi:hypothetical protein